MVSVVIPAHNEARVIGRLLVALTRAPAHGLDVIVVANGCTDDTADVARNFPVTVLETAVASKANALALGDERATGFPRLYVDADVELSRSDVDRLAAALTGGVHGAGPERVIPTTGVSWPVRAYYDLWTRLPAVRDELFGRGVIAVDEVGHARLLPWGDVMADDLRAAMSFQPDERVVVAGARAVVRPPRNYRDLFARRVRAMTANQLLTDGAASPARLASTSIGDVLRVVVREPRLFPAATVFVVTAAASTLAGRRRARRGDTSWLRDESSRS